MSTAHPLWRAGGKGTRKLTINDVPVVDPIRRVNTDHTPGCRHVGLIIPAVLASIKFPKRKGDA